MPPETVLVGSYTYSVRTGQTHQEWGMVNHTEQKITLDEAITPERRRVSLFHELLHCCTELANISDQSTEEQTVCALAPVIVRMLRENPALVAYLTGD